MNSFHAPYVFLSAETHDNDFCAPKRPLFPPHGKYSKEKAVEFVKSIPLADLGKANDVKGQRTLYKADGQNEKVDIDSKVTVGVRTLCNISYYLPPCPN